MTNASTPQATPVPATPVPATPVPATPVAAASAVHAVRVTGMTCGACEHRVVKALGRLPGVRSVSASSARGRALLTGDLPPEGDLRAALGAAGYTLGAPAWVSRDRAAWLTAAAGVVGVVAVAWLASSSGLTEWTPAASLGAPLMALLVGLAAGVSTCMALVGGLVLGVSAASTRSGRGNVAAQVTFTAGRWTAFAVGGAALGALGSAARLPDPMLAGGMLLAAAVMAVLGVRLTGLFPRVAGLGPTLPRGWADSLGLAGRRGAAVAGAVTFLLPCGFTQAVQLYAISLGSPAQAAVVMGAFAVGTTPGLLGLGLLGGLTARRRGSAASGDAASGRAASGSGGTGTATWSRMVGIAVLAFAVVTGTGGLRSLGVPLPALPGTATTRTALAPTSVSANVRLDGARQVVSLRQGTEGYTPADTVVWAGLPIRWEITSTATFHCSSILRVPSLGVRVNLAPLGTHTVELPALPVGTTDFTCVMGMYDGTLQAIHRPVP
jgi:uncharacterized protein